MSDTAVAEAKAPNEWKEMAHTVAREFWRAEYLANNPEATKEDVSKAWGEFASDRRKTTKLALKRLAKKGISISKAE